MNTTTEIKDYAPETRDVLNALVAAGYVLVSVDNGGGSAEKVADLDAAMEAISGVDDAHLFVRCPDGKVRWIYFVFGNAPGELVADHVADDALAAVLDAVADAWEGRDQPMETRGGTPVTDEAEQPERETNEQFMARLMKQGCPTGALIQPFVIQAIAYYAEQCMEAGAAKFDNPMLSGAAWIRTAEHVKAEVKKHLGL